MIGVHSRVLDEKNRTSLQILYSLRQGKENESNNPVQFPKQEDLNTFTLLAQDPDSNFEVNSAAASNIYVSRSDSVDGVLASLAGWPPTIFRDMAKTLFPEQTSSSCCTPPNP